ncbi:SDR family NAD(P)-dependent oxidoreductase [Demetria terragena]|uniref:SDR family NAD(P)-dependent oxidoreductase n=1 Tax=Demetria terragena TaxID=63959 RepID=UPI00035DA4D5|nr:SDR family NAD(P)-dependent oxidoreductase [Demetria terragena]
MQLDDSRILVIGGGGAGIGRACTRHLSTAGASVAIADLAPGRAQEAADEVNSSGGTAVALSGDVRDREQLTGFVTDTVRTLGGLDALVTVVGGQVAFVPAVPLHEMTDEDWDTVYELNLRYVARAVRAVLPVLREQGTGGAIVSVGSVTGLTAAPRQAAYGVMKAGLISLARTVAAEYSAEQIRMNVVAAGAIATAVSGNSTLETDEIPLGRLGRSEEVAEAVAYLVSDSAAYITGQAITIDGGASTRGPFG